MFYLASSIIGSIMFIYLTYLILSLRTVVSTNEVHIVQSSKETISYGVGADKLHGNKYYAWPSWVPFVGVKTTILPISVFSQSLSGYEAYDQGRLPFVLDIVGFFRISDSNIAAQRVSHFEELKMQLESILQGAARTILASKDIEVIMQGRSEFGTAFTEEVTEQLKSWGVTPVKNIELMDIRDSKESQVISNIMEKKKSFIEMESRTEVAKNMKTAENAEIDASREIELNKQNAQQQVGIRTAQKEREVGIASEQSQQEIKIAAKITAEKSMEVVKVNEVMKAEINKQVQIVSAQQSKETDVIKADGEKQKMVLLAEGNLQAKIKEAEGIKVEGDAKGSAETAILMAPVNSQIILAKEIGQNKEYQNYLITIRQVEATEAVGKENARALVESDLRVIVNSGDTSSGIKSLGDIFTSKGGLGLGAALESFSNTDTGKAVLEKVGVTSKAKKVIDIKPVK